jgi:hypothetical protein
MARARKWAYPDANHLRQIAERVEEEKAANVRALAEQIAARYPHLADIARKYGREN